MPLTDSPAWLETLATSPSFLSQGVRIQRPDGEVFCLTSAARDVVINDSVFEEHIGDRYSGGDHVYRSDAGATPSELQESDGVEADNYNLQLFFDDIITFLDFSQRRFANSEVATFTYDRQDLSKGIFELRIGNFGEPKVNGSVLQYEVKSLSQKAAQTIGDVTSEICRHQFGDSGCKVDLDGNDPNGFPYRITATISEVLAGSSFKTVETEGTLFPSDFFERGLSTVQSGMNNGLSWDIKLFDASEGVVMLRGEPLVPLEVGDTVLLQAGCKKTARACNEDHDNSINSDLEYKNPTLESLNRVARA